MIYTTCGDGKIELFKPVHDFGIDRKDVRILVSRSHCALIKNIETFI